MQRQINYFLFLVLVSIMGFSCSTTRSIKSGDYLYKGSRISFDSTVNKTQAAEIRAQLEPLYAPSPNRTVFGVPFRLYWYNFFHSKKKESSWIQNLLGDKPVLYQPAISKQVQQLMENRLTNSGYFYPSSQIALDTAKKKAVVDYQISPGPQYTIKSFSYQMTDPNLLKIILSDREKSYVRTGQAYSLNTLKAERERLTEKLKNQGYYYFEPDYLIFTADTSAGRYEIDLQLRIKENSPEEDLKPMYINRVVVFPDYEVGQPLGKDSLNLAGLVFKFNELEVKPSRLRDAIFFSGGDRYYPKAHQNTLRRLSSMEFYKFVSLRIERSVKADSLLDIKIYLTPRELHSVSGSVGLALISNQFLGPEVSLGYKHRNIFRGAEVMDVNVSGNFNFPLQDDAGNYFEQIEAGIAFTRPGLGIPFVHSKALPSLMLANTRLQLGFERERINLQISNDPEFLDNLFFFGFDNLLAALEENPNFAPPLSVDNYSIKFGYIWQRQPLIRTELVPLSFSYQNVTYGNDDLKPLLQFIFSFDQQEELLLNLENMFVFQPEYIFQYDTRAGGIKRNNYFYRGRLSLAANTIIEDELTLLDESKLENLLLQVENDLRYFLIPSRYQTIAMRLITNVSFPFDDQVIFPITELYSAGGPNSIRAFYPRTIGPGTTNINSQEFSVLQGKGDIKLEGSLEYRHKFTSIIELATFVDAGNVWRIEKDVEESPTRFGFDTFFKQIAIGTGMGLRLDFSYLVFRVDLAFPLTKPWLPEGERWVGNDIRLGDPSWRRENLVLNLAFGYPF